MPAFPRDEMEEMVRRWVEANNEAGAKGDWSKMPNFFTDEAIYSWTTGPRYDFVAKGKQQIAEWAFGTEMAGLETWSYPYLRTLIDDQKGEFIGLWRQVAPISDPDGVPYEIRGTGGSWFRYAGDFKWAWQRDFFDHGCAGATFMEMGKNGDLNPRMIERMKKGTKQPGWVKAPSEFDWTEGIEDREA